MFFGKKKRRPRTDRAKSSEKWRNLRYNKLKNFTELASILDEGVVYIYQLIVTLDAAINRQKMEAFIVANDIRRLKKMQGRFPYDFDEVDYPSLYAYLIKTRLHAYVVMFANDVTYRNLHIIKIMQNDFYDKDGFDTRRLIYPV